MGEFTTILEPILVVGLVDVHWGYWILTHGQILTWPHQLKTCLDRQLLFFSPVHFIRKTSVVTRACAF